VLKFFSSINKLLTILMVLCLTVMSVLIFGNVVLRYVFNTGIVWAEEMSRFLFVWMIFLGALVAFKENSHLGVDMLTRRLPFAIKRILFVISNIIVLFTLWIVIDGSWKMTLVNIDNLAPVTKLPYAYVYGIGIIAGIGIGLIILFNIYKAIFRSELTEEATIVPEEEEAEKYNNQKVPV
jgi:TRAP-type transport system small permease protein